MIEPGVTLNERYRLLKTLGEGGMANVYLAHDLILDRDVAVKVLRLDLQNDPDTVRRFKREAMATIQLVHPNIVSIYDVGESHGQQYLVMEYVQGTDLKKYIVEHFPIPYQQVITIMEQILSAMALAHEHHIIHRDLKPQNILVDQDGTVKITDFGIAVALSDTAMTQTNSMLGSVHYLSPEQARGSMPTRQSDIYALGIILFELLTGSVPFEGESAVSIALKHFQEQMPFVRDFDPRIPQALENVVLKATAKDPNERYTSVEAMAADLKTSLSKSRAKEVRFVPTAGENLDETKVLPQLSTPPKLAQQPEADKPAKKPSKKPKKWPWIVAAVIAVIALIGVGAALASGGSKTAVPDLRGMTQAQAKTTLTSQRLSLGSVTHAYSDTISEDRIIRSHPAANSKVKTDATIDVVISKGPKLYQIADYTGRSYSDVAAMLEKRGFTVKKELASSNSQPIGQIMSQDIDSDKQVIAKQTTITFTVSSGPKRFALRDLSGYNEKSVRDYANELELNLNVENEYSDDIAEGTLIRQNPEAGAMLSKGDTLTVVMSKGKDPATQVKQLSKTISVPYQAVSSESSSASSTSDSAGDSDSATESSSSSVKPVPNQIQVYIADSQHSLDKVYRTLSITEDTDVTMNFTVVGSESAHYRIVRDGVEIMSGEVKQ
ncbi:Stk1 family PASTA domain-containing Ser/Thr kinase [Lacticaseibacillus saniviri]|uniref:non-specific serine/threonine protein kinase n=2 Tax=Lacticaseibacillus saniviri TaxID=931533 RepID=A0A0R2N3G6_9LACO|nr:Stk1 family PASTA domain-containing Ser/Thr kinase [Lacticaseibacillus saniviri]KRO18589.1 hypothetical protein IV56_GL000867 [Lacticaseibacillus saniviri JCM 17471 = DSM 24301]